MTSKIPAKARFEEILSQFSNKRIAVVGDMMLDRYYWGSVHRISPEAPVPVCVVENESSQLGGAANVAHNVKSLGAEPVLFGVIGSDEAGELISKIFVGEGFDVRGIVAEKDRPTTTKLRIIAEDQHIVRVDREKTQGITKETVQELLTRFEKALPNLDAVILEDYNKGVLTADLIRGMIDLATQRKVPVAVDPKFDNFFEYKNSTIFKPNRNELERVLESRLTPENEEALVRKVMDRLACEQLLLTLGRKGMVLYRRGQAPVRRPAYVLEIHDVSGAGDAVITAYTLACVSGADPEEAMFCANLGAAVVCTKVGAQPVYRSEMKDAYQKFSQD